MYSYRGGNKKETSYTIDAIFIILYTLNFDTKSGKRKTTEIKKKISINIQLLKSVFLITYEGTLISSCKLHIK